ncbi:pyrimidine 5'-nucleotidase [Salinarimonas rosea]|uniref:pyrimidine 5'-nucleotidase n=1 Tax=Salinarimonas rosea TaxID=552063 RepID=UPI0004103722|nr:pyrimidine 5'-nucleotidase [Salinarimonas rosea]
MRHIPSPSAARADRRHFVAPDARGFGHVETWIFDLDNTLYSHEARVWPQIDDRITLFVADFFGIDGISARALQKHYYHKYGTTLRALMTEHDIDPHAFMDFVHDIDHRHIELNSALGAAIERLPGRRLILTNGSRKHAEAVAAKIGILDHFEDVFDLADANFTPKPNREAYEIFLERYAVDPAKAAMFEDIAKNLRAPHDLGMTTTLVVPRTRDPFRDAFEQEAVEEPHIDYITDDLAAFLAGEPGA